MMRAFMSADASYDGIFWTAVKTTHIFCKPSCTARKPKPENVEFFFAPKDALFAGYRACKRCAPLAIGAAPPAWVPKLIALADDATERVSARHLIARSIDPARAPAASSDRSASSIAAHRSTPRRWTRAMNR